MTTAFTIQSLIQCFEDRVRQIDRQNHGDAAGKEPQFPQIIIYLGDDARRAHQSLSSGLLQMWPQYQNELKFLWVQAKDGAISFAELFFDSERAENLSEGGVCELASSLFGTRMHYSDRSKLLAYYVMDTTGFLGLPDFLEWLPYINQIKGLLCADSADLMDVLFLLLNENLVRRKTANQIRNHLSGFYQKNEIQKAVGSVMLLSNRRSDNAILEDWEICYQIMAAAIALSNNSDSQITLSFFGNGVITASYAREAKPLAEIGQVVVKGLIDELAKTAPQMDPKLLEDPSLPERLGLTKQGTISLLDQYAESTLYARLPTEDQLEFFPRRDDGMQFGMAELTAKAFDEYTMGAWQQYLSNTVGNIQEKISLDSTARAAWQEQYRALLVKNFSKEEIICLADHLQTVRELMSRPKAPAQDVLVLDGARKQLKYLLSSDEKLVQIFLNALQEQAQVSRDFADQWNSLLKSMRRVHTVRDNNIAAFYERKVRNFCDRHGSVICAEFAGMHETAELVSFLTSTLEQLIDSDEIFSAAFEDELEGRLNEEVLPTDAKQYIREKLTGKGVFVYLQVSFALEEPLISSILLKVGTPLYQNLYNNLANTTYYYNTGSSNTAEALVIYRVSAENLVNGEEA